MRGSASPRTREFRTGEPQDATSVGSAGDWQLRGPGVEPIHAYLYFDGEQLFVQSALEERDVVCDGHRVGNDWVPVEVAAVLEIGTARITLSQINQPSTGASAVARAPQHEDLDPPDGTLPMAKPAPIVISPKGAALVTGEERTSFVPLGPPSFAGGAQFGDDDEATRFPSVVRTPAPFRPHLPVDDDESTQMVSLEAKIDTTEYRPDADPVGSDAGDPYDDLHERTHASTGASAVSPRLSTAARGALDARRTLHSGEARSSGTKLPAAFADPSRPRLEAMSHHTPIGAMRFGSGRDLAPRADVRRAPPDEPPQSEATPPPRANWNGEVLEADGSRERASAAILGYGASSRPAVPKPTQDAEASAVSRSIGELTRVAPLSPEADAARKQAIALAVRGATAESLDTPAPGTNATAPRPRESGTSGKDTKRRVQKTARVRRPDGSDAYKPPPPPMALPQDTPAKTVRPPAGMKKSFDAFATHFEEANNLRKMLYLASPFLVMIAAYILFGPDAPPPQGPLAAAPVVAPSAPLALPKNPSPEADANVTIARPDDEERPVDSPLLPLPADAGAPGKGGKPGKNEREALTPERLAADAYAAGRLDLAIERYRKLVEETAGQPRAVPLVEVLRILESKRASGRQETLEQAPPTKSVR